MPRHRGRRCRPFVACAKNGSLAGTCRPCAVQMSFSNVGCRAGLMILTGGRRAGTAKPEIEPTHNCFCWHGNCELISVFELSCLSWCNWVIVRPRHRENRTASYTTPDAVGQSSAQGLIKRFSRRGLLFDVVGTESRYRTLRNRILVCALSEDWHLLCHPSLRNCVIFLTASGAQCIGRHPEIVMFYKFIEVMMVARMSRAMHQ